MNATCHIDPDRCNPADVRSVSALARKLHPKAPNGAFCCRLTTCIPEDKDKRTAAIAPFARCQSANYLTIAVSNVFDSVEVFLSHNHHR